jgi:predicted membrane protein (TIGR00267 family)
MMKDELGIFEERFESPVRVGLIMLGAFVAGGLVPILPFVLLLASQSSLIVASIATFVSLFLVGVWKTTFTDKHWLPSGLEMVFVGILAAVIPYLIGDLLLSSFLSQFLH